MFLVLYSIHIIPNENPRNILWNRLQVINQNLYFTLSHKIDALTPNKTHLAQIIYEFNHHNHQTLCWIICHQNFTYQNFTYSSTTGSSIYDLVIMLNEVYPQNILWKSTFFWVFKTACSIHPVVVDISIQYSIYTVQIH